MVITIWAEECLWVCRKFQKCADNFRWGSCGDSICIHVNEKLDQHICKSQRVSVAQITSERHISNGKQCKNGWQPNQSHFICMELRNLWTCELNEVWLVHMNIRMVLQQTEIFSLRLWIKIRGVAVSQLRNSLF